jgi:THAP domain
MPRICAVPGCNSSQSTGHTLFAFPEQPALRRIWWNNIPRDWSKGTPDGVEPITFNNVCGRAWVCENHFCPEEIKPSGQRRKKAYPTRNWGGGKPDLPPRQLTPAKAPQPKALRGRPRKPVAPEPTTPTQKRPTDTVPLHRPDIAGGGHLQKVPSRGAHLDQRPRAESRTYNAGTPEFLRKPDVVPSVTPSQRRISTPGKKLSPARRFTVTSISSSPSTSESSGTPQRYVCVYSSPFYPR